MTHSRQNSLRIPLPQGVVVPAGGGQIVPAGPGIRQGLWQTVSDGVPVTGVKTILQDRQGRMWFGMGAWPGEAAAVSCYDGVFWTIFTGEDGLPGNQVRRIAEDCAGALWVATDAGASRYEGQTWTTFTTADGLAEDDASGMWQDRQGRLWVGTSRAFRVYEGAQFRTVKEGVFGRIPAIRAPDEPQERHALHPGQLRGHPQRPGGK
ncbi:MAG: hypothetical protein HYW07_08400 [Candidatus Latescibacteria bacterium]|nr:hypothetical protein [Candidatus Latescibacterota bacterium]